MLKKTIQFKDLDGNNVTEDFYFNLSKAELAEMDIVNNGGLQAYIKSIIDAEDGATIMAEFKKLLTSTIGKRSADNRRFIKNQEVIDDFMQSDAYNVFFMELITDAQVAADFIKAVLPSDLADKVDTVELPAASEPATDDTPAWIKENRNPTPAEVQAMSPDQLKAEYLRKASQS